MGSGQRREARPGSIRALYSALKGWSDTAPAKAVAWFERQKWVDEHQGWTYRDYDEADAGDILLERDYRNMMAALLKDGAKDQGR